MDMETRTDENRMEIPDAEKIQDAGEAGASTEAAEEKKASFETVSPENEKDAAEIKAADVSEGTDASAEEEGSGKTETGAADKKVQKAPKKKDAAKNAAGSGTKSAKSGAKSAKSQKSGSAGKTGAKAGTKSAAKGGAKSAAKAARAAEGTAKTGKAEAKTTGSESAPKKAGKTQAASEARNTIDFRNPEYYRNRELSWLQFDGRCLSEARDRNIVPLFERIKFLSITASNLDEFNMVRVASLKDQVHAGYKKKDIAGLTAGDQLELISAKMQEFVRDQYTVYNRSLVPSLLKAGLEIIEDYKELTEAQCAFLDTYFEAEIYPILTPMAMDSSRPFPLVRNKTLNIGALIAPKESKKKRSAPQRVDR